MREYVWYDVVEFADLRSEHPVLLHRWFIELFEGDASWVRSVFLDPATLAPVPDGEQGVIAHYDLANWNSCLAILTEDLGVRSSCGYTLNGRAKGAEARGCSITVDEVMAANA